MQEYVNIRASSVLDQGELVDFLRANFPKETRRLGHSITEGDETVETRIPSRSSAFERIAKFIAAKKKQKVSAFCDHSVGWYLRKYRPEELERAEVLCLTISKYVEPCGGQCGTVYKTICQHCNLAQQDSELVLDLRKLSSSKDLAVTIAQTEWVASSRMARLFEKEKLTGSRFDPILAFRSPLSRSTDWFQWCITGKAGGLADQTILGTDAFTPTGAAWRCPSGHSLVAELLSEPYLSARDWDGKDVSVTSTLFGQGCNLVRPVPLIIISQRTYRALRSAGIKGFSCEVVHLC